MGYLVKAFKVLEDEGAPALIHKTMNQLKTWLGTRRLGRWGSLRKLLAEWEWSREADRIDAADADDHSHLWADARRKLYAKWGPLPCPRFEIERVQRLHNQYLGDRIFIMGNGPSLNETPLERLEGEYTFGTNRIYLLFDRIAWKPTFYTTLDWRVTPDNLDEINRLDGMTFFFPYRFRGLLRKGEDVFWYWSRYGPHGDGRSVEDRFSYDMTRGVCPGGTVTVAAIQIAYYLGFDPIYLIGCDTDYVIPDTVRQSGPEAFGDGVGLYLESTQDDDPNHFDPCYFGKGQKWHNPNVPEMIKGYENCKRAIEAQGRRIYNATVGGKLEVFDRVDVATLL